MYSSSEDERGSRPRRDLSRTRELTGLRKPASDSENSDSGTGRSLRERMKYVVAKCFHEIALLCLLEVIYADFFPSCDFYLD